MRSRWRPSDRVTRSELVHQGPTHLPRQGCLENSRRDAASAAWRPSSVRVICLCLFTGSQMNPFAKRRPVTSQSIPFHHPCVVKREVQQRQSCLIDLFRVVVHGGLPGVKGHGIEYAQREATGFDVTSRSAFDSLWAMVR